MKEFDKSAALAILDKYQAPAAKENDSVLGNAKAFGLGLFNLPGKALDTLGAAWEYTDVKGSDLGAVKAERDEQARTVARRKAEANDTLVDIMESLPYSVATMGAGAAGSVLGPAGALGASGAVAHRASVNDKVKELLIESEIALGRPPTDEEFENIKASFNDYLMEQGLAEAVPEAVGNLALGGIMGKAGKALIGKAGLRNPWAVGAAQLGLGAAEEIPSEVVTGMLQGASDARAGFRESAPTVGEVFKEVAPTAAGQAVMLGLGLKGAGALSRRLRGTRDDGGTTPSNSPDNPFAGEEQGDGYKYEDPLNVAQVDRKAAPVPVPTRGMINPPNSAEVDLLLQMQGVPRPQAKPEQGYNTLDELIDATAFGEVMTRRQALERAASENWGLYPQGNGSVLIRPEPSEDGKAGAAIELREGEEGYFSQLQDRYASNQEGGGSRKGAIDSSTETVDRFTMLPAAPAAPAPKNSPEIDLLRPAQQKGFGLPSVTMAQHVANAIPSQPQKGMINPPSGFGLSSLMQRPQPQPQSMAQPAATGDNMTPVAQPVQQSLPPDVLRQVELWGREDADAVRYVMSTGRSAEADVHEDDVMELVQELEKAGRSEDARAVLEGYERGLEDAGTAIDVTASEIPVNSLPANPSTGFGLAGEQPVQAEQPVPSTKSSTNVEAVSKSKSKPADVSKAETSDLVQSLKEEAAKLDEEKRAKDRERLGSAVDAVEKFVSKFKPKQADLVRRNLAKHGLYAGPDGARRSLSRAEFIQEQVGGGVNTVKQVEGGWKLIDPADGMGFRINRTEKDFVEFLKGEQASPSTSEQEAPTVETTEPEKEAEDVVDRTGDTVESDSEGWPVEDRVGEESLPDDGRADGRAGSEGTRGAGEDGARAGGESLPRPAAPAAGERSDSEVAVQKPGEQDERGSVSGSSGRGRSGSDGRDGLETGREGAEAAPQTAGERPERVKKDEPKRLREIRKALPDLYEGQQEDVYFAEERWKHGLGVLFTNGTGTGKTGLGLGAIKRLVDAGRKNVLVAVPADKIGTDWADLGKHLGVTVTKLENTKDAGRGVTITTHANMAQNSAIYNREWDLIVIDECHKLIASKDGTVTNLLEALRGLTYHPDGVYTRAQNVGNGPELWDEYQKAQKEKADVQKNLDSTEMAIAAAERRAYKAAEAWRAHLDKVKADVDKPRTGNRANLDYTGSAANAKPGVMLLSATPFAYEKSVKLGDGYLFDFDRAARGGYNEAEGFDKFMVEHFGYRMRYGKLTEPEAKVDRGLLQRQFNSWLKKRGVLSSRQLDTPFDYDRKFILTENAIGQKIDEGFNWLWDHVSDYPVLHEYLRKRFDYLRRQYLLETIKANEAVPLIRENVALGRKVVVFYQYNKAIDTDRSLNPFDVQHLVNNDSAPTELVDEARDFAKQRPDLQKLDLNSLRPSLETLKAAFPDAVVFAGTESKKAREEGVRAFQTDNSGVDVILVQADAGEAGISLHDKTGRHPRVLFNLGLPVKPVTAIQQEGRIFRAGQQSNAMFRYLNTGTTWERIAFAQTLAERSSTAENLALGEEARGLKDAYINAFEDSGPANFGDPYEGTGGKSADRESRQLLSDFDRAKALYWANQKKTSKNKAAEGKDYFPTPEPLGQKMVEWAGLEEGDRMLEPSAGHGAIARWSPDGVDLTVIEPSDELRSRLMLAVDARRTESGTFEDHALMNKYDGIVMNPPFGTGGKLAVEHLAKAFRHLNQRGRIVAIIPEGPSANKHFDRWMDSFDKVSAKELRPVVVREVSLPSVTFERAGTAVKTRVVIIDAVTASDLMLNKVAQQSKVELDSAKSVNELFDRLEQMGAPVRVGRGGTASASSSASQDVDKPLFKLSETEHTKTKEPIFAAKFSEFHDRTVFDKARAVAKEEGGNYSTFLKAFSFPTEEARADFVRQMEEFMAEEGAYASLRPSFASSSPYAALRILPDTRDDMRRVVAEVESGTVNTGRYMDSVAAAKRWVRENIKGTIHAKGDHVVVFDEGSVDKTFSHLKYPSKFDTIPAVREVLKNGAYLGDLNDLDGNNLVNLYWGGTVLLDGERTLVFVRARRPAKQSTKFYVHDVFTEEDIKKYPPLAAAELEALSRSGAGSLNADRPNTPSPRGDILERRIMRTIAEVNGQSRTSVQDVVDKLGDVASGAAPVNVVQSFAELPENLKQNFKDRDGDLEGVYDKGTVWLVADNLASPERVAEVWMHEQVGHGGFEALMPEREKNQLLNRLFSMMGGQGNAAMRALAEEYGLDLGAREGQHRAVREYLADLAEKEDLKGQEMTRWQRAWKHIADTLKKLVYRLTGQNAKIAEMEVRDLLEAMKARVREGGPASPQEGTYASFISDAARKAADAAAKAMKKPDGFSEDFVQSYSNLSAQAKRDLSWWNRFVTQPYTLAKRFPLIRDLMEIQSLREDKRREAFIGSMKGVDTFQKMKKEDPTAYKYARDLIISLDSETGDKLKKHIDEDMFVYDEEGKRTGVNPAYYRQLRELVMQARNRETHGDDAAFERAIDAYMGVRRSLDRDLASILGRMEELGFKSREAYMAEYEKRKAELMADKTLTQKEREVELRAMREANEREQEKLDTLRKSMGRRPFYFPRMRFGDHYAKFTDSEGKTLYRVHYEASTQTQAAYEAARIKARMEAELEKMGVDLADVKFENGKLEGIPQEVFGDALSTVDTQAILERALGRMAAGGKVSREDLAELRESLFTQVSEVLKTSGFGQHMMRRGNTNVAGYETEDVFKSLTAYKAGLHGWLTKMEASYAFASTLSDAAAEGAARKSPKMYGYAKQYVRDMLRNSDALDRTNSRIRAGLFLWFLGGNVKSALVNATQNFTMGVPVLGAEVGAGKAYGKVLASSYDAVADWKSKREAGQESKVLTRDEAAFLDDFQKHGESLARKTMELTGLQERGWGESWAGKLAEWAGKPIEWAEKFNRLSLALAAYRAAKAGDVSNARTLGKYGEAKGTPWSEANARKFAREIVNEAHFVYGKANAPAPVRGFARGLAAGYTFRTYAQSLLGWYGRMLAGEKGSVGRIAAAQVVLHSTVLGGVAAIPFYGTMRTVLSSMFDGEPPEEVAGVDQLDILMYGLPSLAGMYIGGSMELDVPLVKDLKGNETVMEQLKEGLWLAVTGPLGGAGDKVGRAVYYADTGQTGRVLEELAPTALANIIKSYRLGTEGARTRSGKPIPAEGDKSGKPATLSLGEMALQAAGFQPMSRAKGWNAYQRTQEKKAYKSDYQSDLVTRYVTASSAKERAKLEQERMAWNKEHPDRPIQPLWKLAKRRERPVK